ncbi:hypothetical protein C4K22_0900 [Pseudomonas chlororaphis subsp. aurantiaca]|nr:hypothetical protein C4K22_0900 [Pseudomonas chlororaphis subsp. aurantiaca]AZD39992.1 hypothetical protein C4K21_0899 [Pseudomonas chlororaphis subsp. aurantiaca]AZD71257.1 hypothetical protein C4K16_0878 [Pseudomonas chlororaphis subsp. aurantiaca]
MVTGDNRYVCTHIAIYNESDTTLTDVRLLYCGNFTFTPRITYSRHEAAVKWQHNAEDKELLLRGIPPNETVDISIYNPQDFEVVQVLVHGKKITDFMTRRALAKAFPTPLRWRIALTLMCVFGFSVLSYTSWQTYNMVKSNSDYELLSSIPKGFSGCQPYVYDNPPDGSGEKQLERLIKQESRWLNFILAMNNAEDTNELHIKDRVVLCKELKKS